MENRNKNIIFLYVIFGCIVLVSVFIILISSGILPKSVIIDKSDFLYILFTVIIILLSVAFLLIARKGVVVEQKTESTDAGLLAEELKQNKEKEEKKIKKENERIASIVNQVIAGLDNYKETRQYFDNLLVNLSKIFDSVQGIAFARNQHDGIFKVTGTFAFYTESDFYQFQEGEGISGQVVKNKKVLVVNKVPKGYITVLSGAGKSDPNHIVFFPIVFNDSCIALIEFATFTNPDPRIDDILYSVSEKIADTVHTLIVHQK